MPNVPKTSLLEKWKLGLWKQLMLYLLTQSLQDCSYAAFADGIIARHVRDGKLVFARYLFDKMPRRTIASWNAMIVGYSRWGKFNESLSLFSTIHCSGVKPNGITFSAVLGACAEAQLASFGEQIHSFVLRYGCGSFELLGSFLLCLYLNRLQIDKAKMIFDQVCDRNELACNLMIVGYVQRGLLSDASDVFVKMPRADDISWATMVYGFANGDGCCCIRALELFRQMTRHGEVALNEVILDCIVMVCRKLGALVFGLAVHGVMIRHGFELFQSLANALIQLYCDFKAVTDAKKVYYALNNPCLKVSNSLIDGLVNAEQIEDAKVIFNGLNERNSISYNLMLKGYCKSGCFDDSRNLFDKMPCKILSCSNTMICMYSKNGEIDKALVIFEEIKGERDPITWNSMMSAYIQHGQCEEALRSYVTMHQILIGPTRSTFSLLFRACSCIGSLWQGQMFHARLINTPFQSDPRVVTSLVDMYSKCGSIVDARRSFFSSMSSPNVASWTALLSGHANHGLGLEAIALFEHMLEQKVVPNGATFVAVLAACCSAGLVTKGLQYFCFMRECYRLAPALEHYTCIVTLLGRSGYLMEAEEFIKAMPIEPDAVIWEALLSACCFWADTEMSEKVANHLFYLDPTKLSTLITMSNAYAVLGKWEEKMKMKHTMKMFNVKKDPGFSWIDLRRQLHNVGN